VNREQCIDILHKKVFPLLEITKEEYRDSLVGWDIQEMSLEGKYAGVLLTRGAEIHAEIDPIMAQQHARRLLKKYLYGTLSFYGFVTTVSFKDKKYTNFLERLGFKKEYEDEMFYHYKLSEMKFVKEKKCPQ